MVRRHSFIWSLSLRLCCSFLWVVFNAHIRRSLLFLVLFLLLSQCPAPPQGAGPSLTPSSVAASSSSSPELGSASLTLSARIPILRTFSMLHSIVLDASRKLSQRFLSSPAFSQFSSVPLGTSFAVRGGCPSITPTVLLLSLLIVAQRWLYGSVSRMVSRM